MATSFSTERGFDYLYVTEGGQYWEHGGARTKEGLDFLFLRRQHAQRFVTLLHSLAPCRSKASSSVVATNAKTGASNVKHVWSVEVAKVG